MSLDPDSDPFAPPKVPTTVACLHCDEVYDSSLIEWRVETAADGSQQGFWCCPTPGCGGMGFGFDLLPTDPNYQDEHGGWVHDADDADASEFESNGFTDHTDWPPETAGGAEDVPF